MELARLQVLYGQFEEAVVNVENALLLNPRHSLAHAVKGWALGRQGEYLPAQTELEKAIEIDANQRPGVRLSSRNPLPAADRRQRRPDHGG